MIQVWNMLLAWVSTNGAVELPIVLPVVGSSVAAIIRQDGFTPQWNAFIAWAAVLVSALLVGMAENAFGGDPTHVAATLCAIASLLISGALHSLSPYLAYLSWVQTHVLGVYGATVDGDSIKKYGTAPTGAQSMLGATLATDAENFLTSPISSPAQPRYTHEPTPIVLPSTVNTTTNAFFPPAYSQQVTSVPQQQPVVSGPRSVALPAGFDLSALNVTRPSEAILPPSAPKTP